MTTRKEHWENVYSNKQPHEVSWTQDVPETSLAFIRELSLPHSASIIDVGGGDSKLVDHLLEIGYQNITVLDISEKAIERARTRLGERASRVKWVVSDITEYQPESQFDCWHDRATFHFLTESGDIDTYLNIAKKAVKQGGGMIIGTFSDKGPTKCSMLEIHKYTEDELQARLAADFAKQRCVTEDHTTPFQTVQNFLFCSFRRR